jgi:hypothetical protein
MAKTFTAPFAQVPKTLTAVATGAIGTDTVTNTVLIGTAGADGALVTKLTAIPRGTVTASSLALFLSKDNGTTQRLIDSELMAAYTLAITTAIPETTFGNISLATPLRLEAGDKLYFGSQVALAAGIVAKTEWMDF